MRRLMIPFLSIVLICSACASSTPVTPFPLPEAEQQVLHCSLLGTWSLVAIDGRPVQDTVVISWQFEQDGTGLYIQRKGTGMGSFAVTPGDNPFKWRLEGRNIFLDEATRDELVVYRADAYSVDAMTWFNYQLSDQYTLQRVAVPEEGCEPGALEEISRVRLKSGAAVAAFLE